MSAEVEMAALPPCDVCGVVGGYDAKTRQGPWAYLCEEHWQTMTDQRLGTGYGQRLVLREGQA